MVFAVGVVLSHWSYPLGFSDPASCLPALGIPEGYR